MAANSKVLSEHQQPVVTEGIQNKPPIQRKVAMKTEVEQTLRVPRERTGGYKPHGYWTDDTIIHELKKVMETTVSFPSNNQLNSLDVSGLSRAIQKNGGFIKFRKLLGYDLPRKPDGYWTDVTISTELKSIILRIRHFPTQSELRNMDREDLVAVITKHGGFNKFRVLLGHKITKASKGFWKEETIIAELKSIVAQIGHFPIGDELCGLTHAELEAQIHRHGGTNKYREALGFPVLMKCNYWTNERIFNELRNIIQNIGHFPTSRELRDNKHNDLDSQIQSHGGFNEIRRLLGYELPKKPAGYWTEERALEELKIFISEIGHFPKRDEFIAKKKEDLEAALKKYGGTNEFRKMLGYKLIQQSVGYWTEDVIICKLKQAIADIGHFPIREELNEYGVGGLLGAIDRLGGLNYFRILMGYELSRKPPNYWNYENTLKELKIVIEKVGHFPTQKELGNMGDEGLNNAISAHGGVTHFRDLLGYDPLLKPDGYWTEENTLKELKNEIEKLGHFPTGTELHALNRDYLNHAIYANGGVYKFRKLLNFDIIKRPAGHWTYDNVITELNEVIMIVGDFPKKEQLKELDKTELITAMDKYGGSNKFREVLGYELLQKPKGYWTDDTLVNELKLIITKIGHFPTREELDEMERQDVVGAFAALGGGNRFREILGYILPMKPAGYWTEDAVIKGLKPYIDTHGYFPAVNELRNNSSLIAAMYKNGGVDKFRKVFGFPPSLVDNCDLSGYVSRRGVKSEKEVKKILIKYCKDNGLMEPFYNKKIAEHKILEFVMTLLDGTVVGIDVTNTKDLSGWAIIRKYQEKEYHNHVGELWIVVLSNAFSDEQYIKFNMDCPDNVKIMTEWDLIEELQVEMDERTTCKLKALDECTRRNKADLLDKLKNRTLAEYI